MKAQVRTSFTSRTAGKIDEAHLLQPDQLEELRLLTNSEMDSASPFAAILAGQPTLNRQLRMGMLAALDQRIATRFAIKPMDLAESAAYLRHHLTLAGRDEPLFADDADRPAAPRRQRAAPGPEQRRHRRAHRRRRRGQGPRRRRLRQESRRRAHPGLTMHQPGAPGPRPGAGPFPMNPALAAQAGHHRTTAVTRAAALRWWRAGYQASRRARAPGPAQRDRLVASFHAQRAADQQARLDALLLEAIAALAGLLSGPDHPGNRPA